MGGLLAELAEVRLVLGLAVVSLGEGMWVQGVVKRGLLRQG